MHEFPVYSRSIRVSRGEGAYLFDEHGTRYLDMYGGHAVAALGYGHPTLVKALQTQAEELFFQSNSVDLEVRARAADLLVQLAPDPLNRVLFLNSGAEANENALRLAFLATGRKKVMCLTGAFHGRTAAASAVTDHHESWYGFPNEPFEIVRIPINDTESLLALDEQFAALIFEPVQGVGGAVPVSCEFAQESRRRSQEVGALLIADEVQTGIGRTGTLFACLGLGIVPDILTLGKGIAAGFPAAAILTSAELADALPKGTLGTTFGGGPMACALMVTVLQTVAQPEFLAGVRAASEQIQDGMKCPVQGRGLLLGLRTKRPAKDLLPQFRAKGVIAGDSKDPHIVRLLPPLILGANEVNHFLSVAAQIEL